MKNDSTDIKIRKELRETAQRLFTLLLSERNYNNTEEMQNDAQWMDEEFSRQLDDELRMTIDDIVEHQKGDNYERGIDERKS